MKIVSFIHSFIHSFDPFGRGLVLKVRVFGNRKCSVVNVGPSKDQDSKTSFNSLQFGKVHIDQEN